MTFAITIYETPNCNGCYATKLRFKRAGVPFTVLPVTDEVLAEFHHHGFQQAPIVTTGTRVWSGYRLEHIDATIARWNEHNNTPGVTET